VPAADGLAPARQAAAAGRLSESVREYSRYLASHPNDGNAYGELGNVYLKSGRFPEAAQNYYEAASRLVDAGYLDAVAPLMPIMERYEPMLAALVKEKITQSRRGPPR
jgi:tetratricopeptide (TPR) repeat protein